MYSPLEAGPNCLEQAFIRMITYTSHFRALVLNLWFMTLSEVKEPFHRDYTPCISDIYIVIYNSSEITIMK